MQVAHERGQGNIDDGVVDYDDEDAETEDGEGAPAASLDLLWSAKFHMFLLTCRYLHVRVESRI